MVTFVGVGVLRHVALTVREKICGRFEAEPWSGGRFGVGVLCHLAHSWHTRGILIYILDKYV